MLKTITVAAPAKVPRYGHLLVPATVLLLCGLLIWPGASRWAYDDPYITYRYAENLLAGTGLVYNPGLRVLSTTTPGYTLLLAGLGLFWPNLPLLSNVIGLLAILGSGLLLVALLPADFGLLPAVLVALLMALLAPAYTALGSEMPLYTLLILATLLLVERGHPLGAGLLGGLTAVVRPDGALLAVVAVAAFWRQPRALLLAAVGTALAAGPWYLFALLHYGSPIPVTLAAKRAQLAQIAGSTSFLATLGRGLAAYARSPWFWAALPCLAYGLLTLARQRRLPLLLVWTTLYVGAYTALGVSGYHWYAVPVYPALVWLVGYGAWAFAPGYRLQDTGFRVQMVVVLLLLLPVIGAGLGLSRLLARAPEPRAALYAQVGDWLAANTPATASVGAVEVGIIGYHSRRPMVDFAGLIQPEVRASAGNSYLDWGAAAIQRYQPDVVVVPAALATALDGQPWFVAGYARTQAFAEPGYDGQLVIYARR